MTKRDSRAKIEGTNLAATGFQGGGKYRAHQRGWSAVASRTVGRHGGRPHPGWRSKVHVDSLVQCMHVLSIQSVRESSFAL